jgi:hypothetical protein
VRPKGPCRQERELAAFAARAGYEVFKETASGIRSSAGLQVFFQTWTPE